MAKLHLKNDVYYIIPLKTGKSDKKIIAAPGIAQIPHLTSAQRWHQWLGHIGQLIFNKTASISKGLEGVDTSDLATCETCHLSKAQRQVSCEPRPTPNEPLDEVFVDTVGKITQSLNGHQYAFILTDAKSRMRWVLICITKDQIPLSLVKWAESMHHQFGKRVRTLLRDGGSEFSKTNLIVKSVTGQVYNVGNIAQ